MIIAKVRISPFKVRTKCVYVIAKDLERVLECLKDNNIISNSQEIISIDVIANEDIFVDKIY